MQASETGSTCDGIQDGAERELLSLVGLQGVQGGHDAVMSRVERRQSNTETDRSFCNERIEDAQLMA